MEAMGSGKSMVMAGLQEQHFQVCAVIQLRTCLSAAEAEDAAEPRFSLVSKPPFFTWSALALVQTWKCRCCCHSTAAIFLLSHTPPYQAPKALMGSLTIT